MVGRERLWAPSRQLRRLDRILAFPEKPFARRPGSHRIDRKSARNRPNSTPISPRPFAPSWRQQFRPQGAPGIQSFPVLFRQAGPNRLEDFSRQSEVPVTPIGADENRKHGAVFLELRDEAIGDERRFPATGLPIHQHKARALDQPFEVCDVFIPPEKFVRLADTQVESLYAQQRAFLRQRAIGPIK